MIQPRPRRRLAPLQPVALPVASAPSAPPPPGPDDILSVILDRLRGYAPSSRVEIAVRVASFHAGTASDLASAWRCIEMAQVFDTLLAAKGARLVGAGTPDAFRAEIAAQHAAAADHIASSGIEHADEAWPPRPN